MTTWGWKRTDKPSGIDWAPGALAESYARVSRDGGQWILASAVPVSDYYRALEEVKSCGSPVASSTGFVPVCS